MDFVPVHVMACLYEVRTGEPGGNPGEHEENI